MKKGGVIKPNCLAAAWMLDDGRQHGSSLETAIAGPLGRDSILPAMFFNGVLVLSLESRLPVETKPVAVIAGVHPAFVHESISDCGRDTAVDVATIGDRCLATCRRGRFAE